MSNVSVTDAQPMFSDAEMAALFNVLGIVGDVHSEADCQTALTALNAALTDPEREKAVTDLLERVNSEVAQETGRLPEGKVTPIRMTSLQDDGELDDDQLSTGRVLNWRADTQGSLAHAKHVDHFLPSGGTKSTTWLSARWVRPRWKERNATSASLDSFIARAYESLEHQRLPISKLWSLLRVDEWFKRNEVKWRTAEDGVNVAVRHGESIWDVKVMLMQETVFLLVMKDHKTVVKREVERSRPEDFSKTLLSALEGDVDSAYLTLDAVHEAAATHPLALQ